MSGAQPSPASRMAGFISHLRLNGFMLGPAETAGALACLDQGPVGDADAARLALKTLLTGDAEQWRRFDDLFEAYWQGRGRERPDARPQDGGAHQRDSRPPPLWGSRIAPASARSDDLPEIAGREDGESSRSETAAIAASRQERLMRTDLRQLANADDIAAAEALALRLARALVHRLSRRRKAAARGRRLDLRRTIRRNIGRGGEPIDLVHRRRPDRPVRIVVLVDVSASMKPYARFFLLFVRGLMARWLDADAYLFHTRLARITGAFSERDTLAALGRLSLMSQGFGGGTRIAGSLATFNDRYARTAINSRTVVIIMSDGYDCDPPEELARELGRLKRRAPRLVWLNPLLGWREYTPIGRGMTAAMPYIDCFAAAHTLEGLAALEGELARL